MTCAHRNPIYRVDAAGKFHVHCLSCKLDGPSYATVSEAYLHYRDDLRDAAALKAADAAKAGA